MSNSDANMETHFVSRHVTFPGAAVTGEPAPSLEGHLQVPSDGQMHAGAVLCHANPAAGGKMDMKPVLAIEEALARVGIASLRYNSRGIGNSTGQVSRTGTALVAPEGEAEMEDIGAALSFLALQEGIDGGRLALVGHSFGARISLAYLAAHPEEERVQAAVCIGLPVAWRDLSKLGQWPRPKLLVTGERDDFCPPDVLAQYAATLPPPTNMVTLRDTGHFFEGREADLGAAVARFLSHFLNV